MLPLDCTVHELTLLLRQPCVLRGHWGVLADRKEVNVPALGVHGP